MAFRAAFKLASKRPIRWFPGHMGKGLKQMQARLKGVDCVIEVHDARIPFSGRNPELRQTLFESNIKPHILVLNKKDFCTVRERHHISSALREQEGIKNILFTNCKEQQCPGVKQLPNLINDVISDSDRYNRSGLKEYCVMVVGVPNVGKSSLLNVLRNRNLRKKGAAKVGALAGVTRAVMERIKISDSPPMYMIDTPGILDPRISDDEMGMKLALVGCLKDHLVGEVILADYLLYWLNKHNEFNYTHLVGIDKPCDNIPNLLITLANKLGKQQKIKRVDGQIAIVPDINLAAKHFITLFRKGQLGKINLDTDFIRY